MAGIFISHSSKNSAEAEKLRDWLESQGWGRSQVFLDLQDLKSGDSWRDVLNALGEKEAVIVCLSNEWLASHECVREFTQAQERGKPIFPIFVAPVTAPIPRFITDLQIGDATQGGFDKLRDGLLSKRITPQSFPWPPAGEPTRAVYRGLQALDVQDAAIFFGRDAIISRGLDELRRLREGAPERMLVILGASGAGKSSFLRAGLIARLARDEANFLVLPIVRPERAALSGAHGLLASLRKALGAADLEPTAGALVAAFAALRTPVMERLQRHAQASRESYSAKPPTIVIPLDQAEELFGAENAERAAFVEILTQALAADGNAIVVATIRSDSYEALQNGLLSDKQALFTLPAIAAGSFQEIIEGPARLAKPPLTIEPALTHALLADLDAADALPLLAFTLERLQTQYGADGTLTLGDYRDKLGGLSGAIQSAIAAVLSALPSKDKLALARRLFVPALVQVDQDGVKRRLARRADLPAATHALADDFIAQRLLVSDDGKLEVAHEAILRQWPALAGWIAEERGALAVLDGVRAAAHEWQAPRATGSRDAKVVQDWRDTSRLTHRGARLKEAEAIAAREELAAAVDPGMREYLAFCRKAERREQGRRRVMLGGLAASIVALFAAGAAYTFREPLGEFVTIQTRYRPYVHDAAALAALPDLATFQDCAEGSTDCPVMVLIPAGEFLMGDRPPQIGVDGEGGPQFAQDNRQRVAVQRFAVSRTEITFDQWAACAGAGGCRSQPTPGDATWGQRDRPVINISWHDAQEYVAWMSHMTGQGYRLLSEAEWEYAARGVTSADDPRNGETWSFGDDQTQLENHAWFNANSNGQTHPVGIKEPNPFGLRDVHGNVWEWVQDCYLSDPERAFARAVGADSSASEEATGCNTRVRRGGSWYYIPLYLRSAERDWDYDPSSRSSDLGFRVARTL